MDAKRPKDVAVVRLAALANGIQAFDMDLPATPDNVEVVVVQIGMIGEVAEALDALSIVERGKRLIWLKRQVPHGDWDRLLDRLRIPTRSAQRWMAEARWFLDHGRRRDEGLLTGGGGGHFDDADGEAFDAESLADPESASPLPRKDLESRLKRLERQLEALKDRDVKSQEALREKEDEIVRLKAGPDGQADRERYRIRYLLTEAQLKVGQASSLMAAADDEELARQGDGDVRVLGAILSAVQRYTEDLIVEQGHRLQGSVASHLEED